MTNQPGKPRLGAVLCMAGVFLNAVRLTHTIGVDPGDLSAILSAADERDCLEEQLDYYKADLDAIRAMVPNVDGVSTQDLLRRHLEAGKTTAPSDAEIEAWRRKTRARRASDIDEAVALMRRAAVAKPGPSALERLRELVVARLRSPMMNEDEFQTLELFREWIDEEAKR